MDSARAFKGSRPCAIVALAASVSFKSFFLKSVNPDNGDCSRSMIVCRRVVAEVSLQPLVFNSRDRLTLNPPDLSQYIPNRMQLSLVND
jgi:hypothetical protein